MRSIVYVDRFNLYHRKLEKRRQVVGDFEPNVSFRLGGRPSAVSEGNIKLFVKEVLPILHTWKNEASIGAK